VDSVAVKVGSAHSIGIVRVLPLLARFRASPSYDALMRFSMLAWSVASATFLAAQFLKYEREVDPMLPDDLYAVNVAMRLAMIAFFCYDRGDSRDARSAKGEGSRMGAARDCSCRNLSYLRSHLLSPTPAALNRRYRLNSTSTRRECGRYLLSFPPRALI